MSRLDKYRRNYDNRKSSDDRNLKKRHKHIATEAARRLGAIVGTDETGQLSRTPGAADFHAAKMQAVAVLGLVVRPGDLPPDSLVFELYENLTDESSVDAKDIPEDTEPLLPTEIPAGAAYADRFDHYFTLLKALEKVKQNPRTHPEGDALYHSLQVFENVRKANQFDEELLTAALLHDVGKVIDPFGNAHDASIKALQGRITDRTARLIERLSAAHSHRAGTLGHRARRALDHDEDFDAIMLLADADHQGRKSGAEVPTLEEALNFIRMLSDEDADSSGDFAG